MGIFQGQIQVANETKITIIRAFRNGVPLKKPDMEITINATDIEKLDLIPSLVPSSLSSTSSVPSGPTTSTNQMITMNKVTPIKQGGPGTSSSGTGNGFDSTMGLLNSLGNMKIGPSGRNGFNKSPPKIPTKSPATVRNGGLHNGDRRQNGYDINGSGKTSKAIDIPNNSNNTPMKNDRKKSKRFNRNAAFGTPIDDPIMDEDFDFEKNLALFDKQAIWDEIENGSATEKPDLLRQTNHTTQKKYRHDENVLTSKPPQYRQIETEYKNLEEYVTDDGLVIPALPLKLRDRVQNLAETHGLTWERQSDMLSRGATELAMLLLGKF